MGSIEEINVIDVCTDKSHHKTKKQKLDNNSSSPIKTTPIETVESCSHQYKQSSDSPLLKSNGVTAVYAIMVTPSRIPKKSLSKSKYKKSKTSSKKVNKPKLIRVLLDSGSDGDLMFHKKGTHKCFPYSARLVPKPWCTSNGTFHTEGKGKLEIQFVEYSHSKTVTLQPDIVEYDDDSEKPTFDLIIGTESMKEFRIILNFPEQVITIDDNTLPMRDITNLPLPRKKDFISTTLPVC